MTSQQLDVQGVKPSMRKIPTLAFYSLLVLLLLGCSIDLADPVTTTPFSEVGSASPTLLPRSSPENITPLATTTTVPITWAHLDLTGKLIYITSTSGGELISKIQVLDLATGEINTRFMTAGQKDWIYYASVSPDAKWLVMSYIPPWESSSPSKRALYIMPLDATARLEPLFPTPLPDLRYTQVEWSPDGQYLYYVQYNPDVRPPDQLDPTYFLYRMKYPEGVTEKIAEHAFWPRLSSDSTKLVYISIDPESGRNELYVADADGSNPQPVVLSGSGIPEILDAPIFSPDAQEILFSAPLPGQAYQRNWFEKIMGIQVAKAHSIPSDWWSVPLTGGMPTQLTNIQTINLFASISPDRKRIASVSGEGLFIMDLDGSHLTQLIADPGIHGTVSWVP